MTLGNRVLVEDTRFSIKLIPIGCSPSKRGSETSLNAENQQLAFLGPIAATLSPSVSARTRTGLT